MDRSSSFNVSSPATDNRISLKILDIQKESRDESFGPEVPVVVVQKPENNARHLKKRLKFPLCAFAIQVIFVALLAKYSDYPDDGNSMLIRQCDLQKFAASKSSSLAPTPTTSSAGLGLSVNMTIPSASPPTLSQKPAPVDCSAFVGPNVEEPVIVFGPPYQDSQFFIVTGLTLLFLAIRNNSMTSFTMCMFILALCLQWAFLSRGLIRMYKLHPIKPSPDVFVITVFFAAAVMISYGVVLGRASPMQMLVMGMIEIAVATANDYVLLDLLYVNDPGGAMIYNMFGTYFGLAVCWMLHRPGESTANEKRATTAYAENFAYMGTTILWGFWPTAMGAIFTGSTRVRCILNTYFSLTGSGIVGIISSSLLDPRGKFSNSHIQNTILAGAVAMSGAADTMMGLQSAVSVGMIAGLISALTWVYVQPFLAKRLGIVDTCGSHTLHGTPAVFGVIVSAVTAAAAKEETYGSSLYSLFPMMAPPSNSTELDRLREVWPDVKAGLGRTPSTQAWYQILGMVMTFVVAVLSGIITGFVIRQEIFDPLPLDEYYIDSSLFNMPDEDEVRIPLQDQKGVYVKSRSVEGVDNGGLVVDAIVTTRF